MYTRIERALAMVAAISWTASANSLSSRDATNAMELLNAQVASNAASSLNQIILPVEPVDDTFEIEDLVVSLEQCIAQEQDIKSLKEAHGLLVEGHEALEKEAAKLRESWSIGAWSSQERKITRAAEEKIEEDNARVRYAEEVQEAERRAKEERATHRVRNPGVPREERDRVNVRLSDNCLACDQNIPRDYYHLPESILSDNEHGTNKVLWDMQTVQTASATLDYEHVYRFTGFSAKSADNGWNVRDPSSITAKWIDTQGRPQETKVNPVWTTGWEDSPTYDLPNIDVDTITFEFGYSGRDRFTHLGQIKMYGPDLAVQEQGRREFNDNNLQPKQYRWVYTEPAGGSDFTGQGRDCRKTETITTASGWVASVRDWEVGNNECCLEEHYHRRPEEGYMRAACRQEATQVTYNPKTDQCTEWWDIYNSSATQVRDIEPRPADHQVCCAEGNRLDNWVLALTC